MPFLIDTHCHIHFPAYNLDREAVLSHMQAKDIWGITIGTALKNSKDAIQFAESHPNIYATVGLHPSHTFSEHVDEEEGHVDEHELDIDQAVALAKSSNKVVAIGECGLEFYRLETVADAEANMRNQERVFAQHVEVAKQVDLPLVIHCRNGLTRLAELLQESWNQGHHPRGVIHSFTGTWQEAQPLLDLGMHIAVNGIATFPLRKGQDPSTAIDRTIENIPLDRLLVETDSPYLAPMPFRGKRNEPAYVEHVAEHIAKTRRMNFQDVAKATTENARKLFKI